MLGVLLLVATVLHSSTASLARHEPGLELVYGQSAASFTVRLGGEPLFFNSDVFLHRHFSSNSDYPFLDYSPKVYYYTLLAFHIPSYKKSYLRP